MSSIKLVNVNKIYDGSVRAVTDFNATFNDKEFVAIIGPSGCGKTTLLRLIAGLEDVTSGVLYIDDYFANDIAPKNRDIAMVFQNSQLYPNMTVYGNLAFSLKLRKVACPLYTYNGSVELLSNENRNCYLKILSILKCINKKKYLNKRSELANEIDNLLLKIHQNEEVISSLRKPQIGIDKEKIKSLILKSKAINRLDDCKKRDELRKKIEHNIKYYQKHKVPLYVTRKLTDYEIALRVLNMAVALKIVHLLPHKPDMLSGGEKQRVAIGVAAIRQPKLLLMDEPLAHLDIKSRAQLRHVIGNMHKKIGTTTLYVTHDQTEAMALADRIIVMKDGYIQQIGTPNDILKAPRNSFVVSFASTLPINLLNAVFDGKHLLFKNGKKTLSHTLNKNTVNALKNYRAGSYPIIVGVSPDNIVYKDNGLKVTYSYSEKLGVEVIAHTRILGQKMLIKDAPKYQVKSGSILCIDFKKDSLLFFDAKTTNLIPLLPKIIRKR